MSSAIVAVAVGNIANYAAEESLEDLTPTERRNAGIIVGAVLGGIIGSIILWFLITAIYTFIRYKLCAQWTARGVAKKEKKKKDSSTHDIEMGDAPPAYEERDTTVEAPAPCSKGWYEIWRAKMMGTEDIYP